MTKNLRGLAAALAATVVGIVLCTAAFAWHEGYRAYVVQTGSMAPTFRPGDAVVDQPTRAGYTIGDPITVEVAPGTLVTHRFRSVDAQGKLLTKGDANKKPDAWRLNTSQVRGVVASGLPKMGFVLVFLRLKTGVAAVMTSALTLILLWGICFPSETAPAPAPVRQPQRDRRRILIRVPRQRLASDAVGVATVALRRMPPTPPPVRRLPPTPPPIAAGVEGVKTRVVPQPRASSDS